MISQARNVMLISLMLLMTACSASTNLKAKATGTQLSIDNNPYLVMDEPVVKSYTTTTFGSFRFKATNDSCEPMYGVLPLKFNNGYLISDILFFDVGLFFNLREVYPFYEFSVDEGVVRYKKKHDDNWLIYRPTPEEVISAKGAYLH